MPHRKHLYQLMANELSIPHWLVSCGYMGVQIIMGAGYLYLWQYGYGYLFAVTVLLGIVYIVFMRKYFHLHIR